MPDISDSSSFDNVPRVPRATEGGAQEGRETPKQRKEKMMAARRGTKKTQTVPPEVLEFEKQNGLDAIGTAPAPEAPVFHESGYPAALPPAPARSARKRRPRRPSLTSQRMQVSIRIPGSGVYKTPVHRVVDAGNGFFLLLPRGSMEAIFLPEPGAVLELTWDDNYGPHSETCYCPGVTADIPELNVCAMTLVKAGDTPAPEVAGGPVTASA